MGEIVVREATLSDAQAVAGLLGHLGYPNTAEFAREKLRKLSSSEDDTVLVGEADGGVVGVVHLHSAELFHQPGRVGRIMAVVVADAFRRRGIGSRLMRAVEERARAAGCTKLELTSAQAREGAHAFYRQLGFADGLRHLVKPLDESG